MNRLALLPTLLTLSLCLATWSNPATAQDSSKQAQTGYYGSEAEQVQEKSIAQQKSQQRAEQRMARLEAMRWYGFSASRPTASGMPFTSSYSPSWTRPGGRPFSWYSGGRPGVVISRPYHRPYRAYRY